MEITEPIPAREQDPINVEVEDVLAEARMELAQREPEVLPAVPDPKPSAGWGLGKILRTARLVATVTVGAVVGAVAALGLMALGAVKLKERFGRKP